MLANILQNILGQYEKISVSKLYYNRMLNYFYERGTRFPCAENGVENEKKHYCNGDVDEYCDWNDIYDYGKYV